MKTLIVYYSLSGTTQIVATALASEIGADLEQLQCNRYAPGVLGYIRAATDSWKGMLPAIATISRELPRYDLVVVAGPIWAFRAAAPIRAFVAAQREKLPRVAFLLTHGGSAAEQSLQELEAMLGHSPVATLVVREVDVKAQRYSTALSAFAKQLQRAEAA